MNKIKSSCEDKKQIIRYPEDSPPKRLTVQHKITEKESKSSNKTETPKQNIPETKSVDLGVPTLNYINGVKKRIKKVEQKKPAKVKSASDLCEEQRTSLDEKVITKQMNFPFDKKLYKELISLNLSSKPIFQQTSTSYEQPPLRDKVPRLEDFFTPPENFEYSIPVSNSLDVNTSLKQFNGLRVHKVMRTWKDNRPD